jgi:hypothetical protein
MNPLHGFDGHSAKQSSRHGRHLAHASLRRSQQMKRESIVASSETDRALALQLFLLIEINNSQIDLSCHSAFVKS